MLVSGTHIGEKYRLVEPIGQGGMATVWRAEHMTLGRPVAVKFLEGVGTDVSSRKDRFLREARLVGSIRHRHVVDVMDFGVTEQGQPYMVMELLEGRNLAERLAGAPRLDDEEVLNIVSMTLSGLGAVHDQGVIHRDVKPENIFLVEDADGFFPKIVDFGISRGFQGEDGSKLTQTGGVVGTPSYMSPEQARGLKDVDARTDLFSVGVILYECLTGKQPFVSENPGDILIMIASHDPEPPELLRPDLPDAIASIIDRALSRDRDARFQNAREMRDALEAARPALVGGAGPTVHRVSMPSHQTVDGPASSGSSGGYALPRDDGRRRVLLALAALLLVVVLGAGAFAMLRGEPAAAVGGNGAPAPSTAANGPAAGRPDLEAEVTAPSSETAGVDPGANEANDAPLRPTKAAPGPESAGVTDLAESAEDDAPERATAPASRPAPRARRAGSTAMRDRAASAPAMDEAVPAPGGFIRDLDY